MNNFETQAGETIRKMHISAKKNNRKVSSGEISEVLVKYFCLKNKVYCTRDDKTPEIWIYQDGIFIPLGSTYLQEFCREVLGEYYCAKIFNNALLKIKADSFINPDKFFNEVNVNEIPVLNGILNLSTRKLRDYTPDDIFFHKLPVVYDPKATCPLIDRHLNDVLKCYDDKKVLYELVGYCLDRTHFIEKAFMFVGNGRNGKGKTLELFKRFLGAESCCSVPLSSMKEDGFNIHQMHGKMVNLAGDLTGSDLKNTGLFKSLTGRDLITAHRKFMTDLIFISTCKNIFACNELPKVFDLSKGFWSRWILLEFPFEFVKAEDYQNLSEEDKQFKKIMDTNHLDKIISPSELSGLLNKALDGLDTLRKNKDFSYSTGTEEIKLLWVRMSNSFTAFCYDCLAEEEGNHIPKAQLRRYFNQYCKIFHLKGCGDKEIHNTLNELFAVDESKQRIGDEQVNTWRGIVYLGHQGANS